MKPNVIEIPVGDDFVSIAWEREKFQMLVPISDTASTLVYDGNQITLGVSAKEFRESLAKVEGKLSILDALAEMQLVGSVWSDFSRHIGNNLINHIANLRWDVNATNTGKSGLLYSGYVYLDVLIEQTTDKCWQWDATYNPERAQIPISIRREVSGVHHKHFLTRDAAAQFAGSHFGAREFKTGRKDVAEVEIHGEGYIPHEIRGIALDQTLARHKEFFNRTTALEVAKIRADAIVKSANLKSEAQIRAAEITAAAVCASGAMTAGALRAGQSNRMGFRG